MKTLAHTFIGSLMPLFLLYSTAFAQSYVPYYNMVNRASESQYLKNAELALAQFDSAISMVPYVHTATYKKAALHALKQGVYPKAYSWIKQAILQGAEPNFWKSGSSRAFRKTPYYSQVQDSLTLWIAEAEARVNQPYKALIDSLHFVDQWVIRDVQSAKRDYQMDLTGLPEDRFYLDTVIWDTLLAAIDRWGFPSEQTLGYAGYRNSWVLLHHNARLPENTYYLPMMREAVIKGEYDPNNYALMYDQSLYFREKAPLFYLGGWVTAKGLTEEELAEVDVKRAELGVRPLSAYVESVNKRGIKRRRLW